MGFAKLWLNTKAKIVEKMQTAGEELPESDVYGKALYDYYKGNDATDLFINTSYGESEEMPVEVFYRDFDDFPLLEAIAIENCQGKILDVGAGTGCHSLIMQDKGLDVTPIDVSAYCVKVMRSRGIEQVRQSNFFNLTNERFDTILLLMNGLGIVEKLERLPLFLKQCENLLSPGGKVLFDSSNVQYLQDEFGVDPKGKYIGEIAYQYVYKGKAGKWFNWLYVDKHLLKSTVRKEGWRFELLFENEENQYVASIIKGL
jgi:2-polyprenyl-3-methyl-5-hydroxy-6-metoxy-1,4-benzoquinol methylase